MQKIERILNMNIAKKSQLVNPLSGGSDHPLIRKVIHIPFTNFLYKYYIDDN